MPNLHRGPPAMIGNTNGNGVTAPNPNPAAAAWMNQHQLNLNPTVLSRQQQISNISTKTSQQQQLQQQQQQQLQHNKQIQMMQLHGRLKQQGGPVNNATQQQQQKPQHRNSWNTNMQPPNASQNNNNMQNRNMMHHMTMGNNLPVGQLQQQQQQSSSSLSQQKIMQFQMQQQKIKQLQMQQAPQQQQPQSQTIQQQKPQNKVMPQQQPHNQNQMPQQQPLNQMPQQQPHNQMQQQQPHNQMMQQQQLQQIQQMQALEEQKRRYSLQIQQLQNQQAQQAHNQMSRPTSASSHQSLPQSQLHNMTRSTSISSQADRRESFRMGSGTPLSPTTIRPSSTQPMRPPSRPSSQFSQASAHSVSSQQNVISFPVQVNPVTDPFYKPVSSAKNRQSTLLSTGESSSISSAHNVAFDINISKHSQPPIATNNSTTTATRQRANEKLKDSSASSQVNPQQTISSSPVGKKVQRRNQVQYNSPLTYEEVAKLANSCTTEEKIVWVARQVLGPGNSNGFQKATSTMQRMKRQRARSFKQKEGGSSAKDGSTFQDEEERLKRDTFNYKVAKRMQAEMKQGLQFCNLMTDVIRSILEDIDPENPVLLVQPPMIGTDADFASMPSSLPSLPLVGNKAGDEASHGTPNRSLAGEPTIPKLEKLKVPESPRAARKARLGVSPESETIAEGNPKGSTLRKLRKRSSGSMPSTDLELLKMVGEYDDQGKKLSKKELSYRLFEASRFRTLEVGDYVAAKVQSHDLWILARVTKHWEAIGTYEVYAGLTESKRDSLFKEKVYIRDNDEYTGDLGSARPVNRQHVLPLPRSFGEASDWGTRIRKGSRVYAMYPHTTALYCGTVVDSTTFCRNQDDIIVVLFDGDEDDSGIVPQRHIPARFVTLIPREFPASQNKNRRKSATTTPDVVKKRVSNSIPATSAALSAHQQDSSLDETLLGIIRDSSSSGPKKMDNDDQVLSSTPRTTPSLSPPPLGGEQPLKLASRKKSQAKRPNKRQRSVELASSHFL